MLIFDVEELIQRAKKKYGELKDINNADFQDLNTMLFTDATAHNINTLESWLDAREDQD